MDVTRAASRLVCFCLLLGLWAVPTLARVKENPRILLLHPYNETFPSSTLAGDAARRRLAQRFGRDIEIHSDFLNLARFPGEQHKQSTATYLAGKYNQNLLDLVIALDIEALRFALAHRAAFGSATPLVYCCASSSTLATFDVPRDVVGIVSDYDLPKTLGLAQLLQPDARRLVVVAGNGEPDRRWAARARRELAEHEARLDISYLLGLERDALLEAVSRLPKDTIVLMLPIYEDGAGRRFIPREIMEQVAKTAGAPVYSPFDTLLGRGVIGGYMDDFGAIGEAAADLAIQILAGRSPDTLPRQTRIEHRYVVDAGQLARWGLSESRLPRGSVVLFKQPSLWEQHRGAVVGAVVAFAAMTTGLALLLVQVARRRRAEARYRESEERLGFAAASADIGLWQYDTRSRTLWSSDHCRTMFGLPNTCPLTADALVSAVHPDDRHLAIASIRAATFGTLTDGVSEIRVLAPTGQVRWLQALGRTELDENRKPLRVSGIFRDISRYKSAQEEAHQLSRRLASIQDEERQLIARELHDSTAQHLAVISLNLMALKGKCDQGDSSNIFTDIEESLHEASRELRAFTYLLHPPALTTDGLMTTLRRYAEGFRRRTGLDVTVRSSGTIDHMPLALQQAFLRIIQEALWNVHRHASATRVTVRLTRSFDRFHLIINDNGRGLLSEHCQKRGLNQSLPAGVGIAGMTARARSFGGTLDIRSKSRGTCVHVTIPASAQDAPSTAAH